MGEKMVVDSSSIRCLTPSNTCTRRMLYTETSSLKTCSMTNSSTSKSAILASLNTKISTNSTACFSLAISNHTLQKLREMRFHTTSKTSSWVSFLTVASTDQHFQKLESTHG